MEKEEKGGKLVFVIIIILIVIVGFAVKIAFIDTNKLDLKTESELLVEKRQSNIIKREKAKENNTLNVNNTIDVGEAQPTDSKLEDIAKVFNASSYITDLKSKGTLASAEAVGEKLKVYINGNGTLLDISFKLENGILSTNIIRHSKEELEEAKKLAIFPLIDCIGKYKKVDDGIIYKELSNAKSLSSYNLENNGFELEESTQSNELDVRIDLNNDFSYFKK